MADLKLGYINLKRNEGKRFLKGTVKLLAKPDMKLIVTVYTVPDGEIYKYYNHDCLVVGRGTVSLPPDQAKSGDWKTVLEVILFIQPDQRGKCSGVVQPISSETLPDPLNNEMRFTLFDNDRNDYSDFNGTLYAVHCGDVVNAVFLSENSMPF